MEHFNLNETFDAKMVSTSKSFDAINQAIFALTGNLNQAIGELVSTNPESSMNRYDLHSFEKIFLKLQEKYGKVHKAFGGDDKVLSNLENFVLDEIEKEFQERREEFEKIGITQDSREALQKKKEVREKYYVIHTLKIDDKENQWENEKEKL